MVATQPTAVPQPAEVQLPGGLWRGAGEAAPLRSILLRAVSDADRVHLLETQDTLPVASRASELLARCVSEAQRADLAALSVGDREALLLSLHRLTFGETLECVLCCPVPGCNQHMELAPRVADLLVARYDAPRAIYELELRDADASFRVSFRLPTSGDLDAVNLLATRDVGRAESLLFERCIDAASRDGAPLDFGELPATVRDAIAQAMLRLDPQAQVELDVTCPACGHEFEVLLDAASFLLRELDAGSAQLLNDVHLLASQYGWSERDILAMPARRRAHYIDLVTARRAAST